MSASRARPGKPAIALLVTACQSRVSQVLRAPSSSLLQVDRIEALARRMVDDHGMPDEHARWAVGKWAVGLGLLQPEIWFPLHSLERADFVGMDDRSLNLSYQYD